MSDPFEAAAQAAETQARIDSDRGFPWFYTAPDDPEAENQAVLPLPMVGQSASTTYPQPNSGPWRTTMLATASSFTTRRRRRSQHND